MAQQLQTQRPSSVPTVRQLLEDNREAMNQSLPKHIQVDRLIRIVLTQLTKNPRLQDCTQGSLIGGILQSALLGLEPDGVDGALIPYNNHGMMEAQFQPMYQGLIKLAHMSEQIKILYGEVVHENDKFEIKKGLHPDLIHVPAMEDRGKIIGAYAVYNLVNGGADFEYMTLSEIEKVRAVSKARKDSPWIHWWGEMAKKTVIKRLAKRIPRSRELKDAVDFDNQVMTDKAVKVNHLFDQVGFEKPKDLAPEIAEPESIQNGDDFMAGLDNAGKQNGAR